MTTTAADHSTANLAAIRDLYGAFGRGDIPAILAKIAPGCRWESWKDNRAQRQGLPAMQPRTGPDGAAEVVIDVITPAGGRYRDEEVHLWTLDDRQQITRLRHYVDTAKHIAAFAGEDTTS